MNSFQILLNNRFTGSTTTISSDLQNDGDYLVYLNSNGGGLVNAFNVRGYLNDPRNQQTTTDFFIYLTGNTTQAEALNILTSDQKLANVFNSYYQNFILSASSFSNTAVIDQNLTGTVSTAITSYFHPWIGQSEFRQLTGVTESIINSTFSSITENVIEEFTDEQSYFIPVTLKNSYNQIPRLVFEPCDPIINKKTQYLYPQFSAITEPYFANIEEESGITNTLIQCFVDLNLNTNAATNSGPEILDVSFESDFYNVDEGTILQVKISLSQPSILGFEELSILLNPFGATLSSDFIPLEQYPVTLAWAVGEQDKYLTFNINNDYEEEVIEPFILQFAGAINVNFGTFPTTTVYIKDKTRLNYISLVRALYPADNSGITHLLTDEDNDIDFSVSIDHPAYGVESVTLEQVSSLNTINGQVGPASNPLNPSDYVLVETVPGQPNNIVTLPYTINFSVGETSRNFLLFAKDNNQIDQDKIAYFQLRTAVFSKIDQSQKNLEVTVKDNDGKYKYVHLNFGKIYNEFGNGNTNPKMRMIDPQTGFFGGYQNMYVRDYSEYLIEYNETIIFSDYSYSQVQRVSFNQPYIKAKITNTGTFQSIINNVPINPGQSITIVITGNDFIIAATTNTNKNVLTDFYDDASYKIEMIDNYEAISYVTNTANQQAPLISGFNPFKLMNTDNSTQAINKTINLGTFTLPGYTVLETDSTYAYHLKSHYLDFDTAREETTSGGGFFGGGGSTITRSCPIVGNVSYSEFNKVTIENIYIFGIIFLNYNTTRIGNNDFAKYNGFEFVDYTQVENSTCSKTTSTYNGLKYYNLPFTVE